jgi:hypothetical protein
MKNQRWCVVLPPAGAARTAALHTAEAFTTLLDTGCCKVIDSYTYLQLFEKKCISHDDTFTVDLFNQSCAIACLDFEASHCLVCALAPITRFTLQLLQKYNIVTCHWFYEDFHKAIYWQSVLPGYDHFFAIQHGNLETACIDAHVRFHFLPTAAGCGNYPYNEIERNYDIVFIGIPSVYRISVLECLVRTSTRLAIAGAQWETYHGILEPFIVSSGWIDEADAFQLMQQSIIGINLSFDNPTERGDVHISPRIFDLAAAGCIVVSEETPLLHETLSDVVCHTFTDSRDAVATITSLLADRLNYKSECVRNRSAILTKHQYIHRASALLHASGFTE